MSPAYAAGDLDRAKEAWEASVEIQPNVVALRNLGVLAVLAGRPSDGIPLLRQAYDLVAAGQGADDSSVAHEVLLELLDALVADDAASALQLVDSLPRTSRQEARVLLCEARAALAVGDPDRCRAVLTKNVEIGDVREGEMTFEAVWGELSAVTRWTPPPYPCPPPTISGPERSLLPEPRGFCTSPLARKVPGARGSRSTT